MMMSKLISSVHHSTYSLSPPSSWKPPHLIEAQGTDATPGFPSKHLGLSLSAAAAYTINSNQYCLGALFSVCILSLSQTHTHIRTCVVNRSAYCLINPPPAIQGPLASLSFVLPQASCIFFLISIIWDSKEQYPKFTLHWNLGGRTNQLACCKKHYMGMPRIHTTEIFLFPLKFLTLKLLKVTICWVSK